MNIILVFYFLNECQCYQIFTSIFGKLQQRNPETLKTRPLQNCCLFHFSIVYNFHLKPNQGFVAFYFQTRNKAFQGLLGFWVFQKREKGQSFLGFQSRRRRLRIAGTSTRYSHRSTLQRMLFQFFLQFIVLLGFLLLSFWKCEKCILCYLFLMGF